MNINELLAKSDGTTLRKHTEDVVQAAQRIYEILDVAPDMNRAAFYHDVGKASLFFQQKMHGGKPDNWYRHELLSLLLTRSLSPEQALSDLELAAIATHHRNLDHEDLSSWVEEGAEKKLETLAREQLPQLWHLTEKVFGNLSRRLKPSSAVNFLQHLTETAKANTVWSETGNELARHRAALVAADHLASSGVGETIPGDTITQAALEAYMRYTVDGWTDWRSLQKDATVKIGSAMLVAPTGAGKTEAALLWAIHNRKGHERIFYVLPYQVSINAMADRISKAFPDTQAHANLYDNENVSILHANMDLAYLQDALNDALPPERAKSVALANKEAARKIYAPIKVTTVYQLLDIFFGRKFFEVGLLELTDSLVIFDEIHAYDGHTLGLILVLLEYLRKLNARTFIMTATLPKALQDELQEAAGITEQNVIRLPKESRLVKEVRRQVFLHKDRRIEDMTEEIRAAVRLGKKTAVVCNTVDKAICLWESLQDLKPLLIHSRFTIGDRATRESKENLEKNQLVISTQVIEVSLDISFGVMFTELAPIDDLLQRFGRVNRHGEPDSGNLGACHIACGDDEGSNRIYDSVLLQKTKDTLFQHAMKQEPCETASLDFVEACHWIEEVYPSGLSEKEAKTKDARRKDFADVVAELRPMLDPPSKVEDLELTLFDSVQVIPAKYAKDWAEYKKEGNHLDAKRSIVNVHRGVWNGAVADSKKRGYPAYRVLKYKRQEYLAALFEYDEGTSEKMQDATGLRLDRPLPATHDIEDRIICDDSE